MKKHRNSANGTARQRVNRYNFNNLGFVIIGVFMGACVHYYLVYRDTKLDEPSAGKVSQKLFRARRSTAAPDD